VVAITGRIVAAKDNAQEVAQQKGLAIVDLEKSLIMVDPVA
jgi:hypothetical protein